MFVSSWGRYHSIHSVCTTASTVKSWPRCYGNTTANMFGPLPTKSEHKGWFFKGLVTMNFHPNYWIPLVLWVALRFIAMQPFCCFISFYKSQMMGVKWEQKEFSVQFTSVFFNFCSTVLRHHLEQHGNAYKLKMWPTLKGWNIQNPSFHSSKNISKATMGGGESSTLELALKAVIRKVHFKNVPPVT